MFRAFARAKAGRTQGMVAMVATKQAQWQPGEVDPLDLNVPYEPVAEPVRQARLTSAPGVDKVSPLPNQLYQGDTLETLMQWEDNYFPAI